ncbi:asparagine synthase (glutamine-hydrolyzing) [Flagellimonas allohymeniacidonis]|uniref:asparagine synthase (glutamine-hydrolyzing) n=1 Tax=Flagellimonas allohymeniacidonis TaxID=2517819 RepID=A0A4Q8QFU9_9FLAO|nr:asparagine synthase (glutamine-hydrolyzing) [Allomuricauda hymeniacidonis]TAI48587.1 asparagine synthase (glutamine-hydrolyzing) [Allomuricauda hymeniacidonis]
MCGFLFSDQPQAKEDFLSKLALIDYRGPDHTGYLKIENLHFGHVRLSILDLDPRSNQPFRYKNLTIIYNGEIYNYLEVKAELEDNGYSFNTESDTEVLIIGYHAWGSKVLSKINGMFAFIIHDSETDTIFGARDRMGVKPMYYTLANGIFEVCSQLGPIAQNKGYTLNEDAISMYLDCKFIPSPYSIYQEVQKLEPGCYFEYALKDKKLKIERYWDLQKVQKFKGTYNEAKEQLKLLLKDAVKIRLYSDVPLGSFLSSGIDSALVTSIASQINNTKLNTFTVGFDDKIKDESGVAEKYAELLDTNHKTLFCNPDDILENLPTLLKVYDEPFADDSALPSLLLNSMTKKHVTVALSGDGGDESFLGYGHFESLLKYRLIMNMPYHLRKVVLGIIKVFVNVQPRISSALLVRRKHQFMERIFSRMGLLLLQSKNGWLRKYDHYRLLSKDFIQQAADLNTKLWLENDSNVKVDRASMAYAVEVRSPFLDYRIVEFARTLPINYRLRLGNKKRILRDLLSDYLPQDLFNLPKRGFSMPLTNWLRNELKNDVLQTIDDTFLSSIPNLNTVYCKKVLGEHMSGAYDHTESIWKLYVLAKWLNQQNKEIVS